MRPRPRSRKFLAAGDDDVLRAVPELDVTVGIFDAEIAGMKPAARESLVGRGLVLEIPFHDDIAAKHHFAHRLAVGGHALHRFGINDVEPLQRVIAHALARLQHGLLVGFERVPFVLPVVDDRRTIGLGQPIEMRDFEAGLLHRARTAAGGGAAAVKNRTRCGSGLFSASLALRDRHHDRRAAEMRHSFSAIRSYIVLARTCRRQTWMPAFTLIDQGKHQPLQWNIGSVQR